MLICDGTISFDNDSSSDSSDDDSAMIGISFIGEILSCCDSECCSICLGCFCRLSNVDVPTAILVEQAALGSKKPFRILWLLILLFLDFWL